MRVTGEIRERYGRDENNPSRAQTPLYKGYPSDDGRDEGFYRFMHILSHFGSSDGIRFDHYKMDLEFGIGGTVF